VRARIERERGAADEQAVNIKTGRGGLVDVEFLVQMLQLRHGQAHPAVRVRDTPGAITALAAAGLLPPADARALADGYAFLRALESRLRLEHNQPLEVTAADPAALRSLARRLGYGGTDAAAVAALRADHARHGEAIRAVYDRHFARGAR
jgi:glutamate-ammonia-ligase adenylyltransferase